MIAVVKEKTISIVNMSISDYLISVANGTMQDKDIFAKTALQEIGPEAAFMIDALKDKIDGVVSILGDKVAFKTGSEGLGFYTAQDGTVYGSEEAYLYELGRQTKEKGAPVVSEPPQVENKEVELLNAKTAKVNAINYTGENEAEVRTTYTDRVMSATSMEELESISIDAIALEIKNAKAASREQALRELVNRPELDEATLRATYSDETFGKIEADLEKITAGLNVEEIKSFDVIGFLAKYPTLAQEREAFKNALKAKREAYRNYDFPEELQDSDEFQDILDNIFRELRLVKTVEDLENIPTPEELVNMKLGVSREPEKDGFAPQLDALKQVKLQELEAIDIDAYEDAAQILLEINSVKTAITNATTVEEVEAINVAEAFGKFAKKAAKKEEPETEQPAVIVEDEVVQQAGYLDGLLRQVTHFYDVDEKLWEQMQAYITGSTAEFRARAYEYYSLKGGTAEAKTFELPMEINNAMGQSNNMLDSLAVFPIYTHLLAKRKFGAKVLDDSISAARMGDGCLVQICPIGIDGDKIVARVQETVVSLEDAREIEEIVKKQGKKKLSAAEKYDAYEAATIEYFSKHAKKKGRVKVVEDMNQYIADLDQTYLAQNLADNDGNIFWNSYDVEAYDCRPKGDTLFIPLQTQIAEARGFEHPTHVEPPQERKSSTIVTLEGMMGGEGHLHTPDEMSGVVAGMGGAMSKPEPKAQKNSFLPDGRYVSPEGRIFESVEAYVASDCYDKKSAINLPDGRIISFGEIYQDQAAFLAAIFSGENPVAGKAK